MLKKHIIRGGFIAATMSMLVACGETPVEPTTPTPTASATTEPSTEPTEEPSTTPSEEPSTTPSEEPSTTPSEEPSTDPSASVEPTPTPLPTATSDISVIERTTFNGSIYDDSFAPLDGVTIVARSLNSSVEFEETTTTAGGSYAFNNAPAGVQIEITASKPGYTTRKRVEVLKSNKQGDPDANRYNFGSLSSGANSSPVFGGTEFNALSDMPEVISMTPGRNASGIDPKTSFVFTFSEAMDKKTVEDNFVIRSYNAKTLSVDKEPTFEALSDSKLTQEQPTDGTKVWDKNAFAISWNNDSTEVTFTFIDEQMLPTDEDSANTPDYYVTFTNHDKQLKDVSGVSRNGGYFKLTEGNFEGLAKFAISTDKEDPRVVSVRAETDENSGVDGDMIRVRFSERMIHYTEDKTIAGGMDDTDTKAAAAVGNVTAAAAANNYLVTVKRSGTTFINRAHWGDKGLGGSAVFDTADLTHKTVKLLPPTVSVEGGQAAIATKDPSQLVLQVSVNGGDNYNDYTMAPGLKTLAQLEDDLNLANIDGGNKFKVKAVKGENDQPIIGTPYYVTYTGANPTADKIVVRGEAAEALGIVGMSPVADGADPSPVRLNLYKPGDNITVEVATTVLDPAGNSISSSNDDASGNAS